MDGIFFNGLKPLNDAIFSILKHKGLHQFSRFPISKAKYKEVKALYRLDLFRGAVQP
jgi:hypothetical protein